MQYLPNLLRNRCVYYTFVSNSREHDYEYMVFSTLSIERAWASVILAEKRDIRRHPTTGLSEIVVVGETSSRLVIAIGSCLSPRQRLPLGNKFSIV